MLTLALATIIAIACATYMYFSAQRDRDRLIIRQLRAQLRDAEDRLRLLYLEQDTSASYHERAREQVV